MREGLHPDHEVRHVAGAIAISEGADVTFGAGGSTGGRIWVDSIVSSGSTFTFALQLLPEQGEAAEAT